MTLAHNDFMVAHIDFMVAHINFRVAHIDFVVVHNDPIDTDYINVFAHFCYKCLIEL